MKDKDMQDKEIIENSDASSVENSAEAFAGLSESGIEIIDIDDDDDEGNDEKKNIFRRMAGKIRKWKRKKPVAILLQLISSLFLLAVAGGIGIFAAVGQVKGGPKVFAEEYFEYYINNNWYNMYQNTEITESEFINLTSFAKMMSQNTIEGSVTDYEVTVESKDSEYATVRINYNVEVETEEPEETTEAATEAETTAEGEAEETEAEADAEEVTAEETEAAMIKAEGTYVMTLKRQPENILLVFTTWQGYMDNYIIENCTIEAPSYVTVSFDGTDIAAYATGTNEETGNTIYTLDRVFMGEHDIKLEGDDIDTITETVFWDDDNEKYELVQGSIAIKSEHEADIKTRSAEILQAYYASGLSDGSADGIKALVVESEEAYAHIDEQISAMYNEINYEDGRTLISMEITSLSYELTDFVYDDSVTVNMNYEVSYSAKTGRTVINGYRRSYTGKNTASASVYFKYTDGEWKITDAVVTCVDYTVEDE